MSNKLEFLRPLYSEIIAKAEENGDVVFTDQMNKFIDDLIDEVGSGSGSGVTFDGGSLASPVNSYLDGGTL